MAWGTERRERQGISHFLAEVWTWFGGEDSGKTWEKARVRAWGTWDGVEISRGFLGTLGCARLFWEVLGWLLLYYRAVVLLDVRVVFFPPVPFFWLIYIEGLSRTTAGRSIFLSVRFWKIFFIFGFS